MFPTMMGAVIIAGIVGYLSEKTGFTHNGILPSIIICVGGALVFYFFRIMFGFSFGPPGIDAIISSVCALIIVPTHWRK